MKKDSHSPLNSETAGSILDKRLYSDLYRQVLESDQRFFARQNQSGDVDIVIIFQDIDDFGESSGTQIMLDFQRYKDRFYIIVWTLTDPQNPLGFPVPFRMTDAQDKQKAKRILEQGKLWIHYAAEEDEQLIHIYSEAYEIPKEERKRISSMLEALFEGSPEQEGDETELVTSKTDMLGNEELKQSGIGYSFDFSAMISKWGEEQAQEKLMSGLLQALHMIKRHPRSEAREASFLIWAAEKREQEEEGKDARLLTVFLTPSLIGLFAIVNDNQENENPLSTVLLALPEFLMTIEEKPLNLGAYPLIKYEKGTIIHFELDVEVQHRLADLYGKKEGNPYL